MNGRACRDGLRLARMPLAEALDVAVSYIVDDELATTTVQVAEDRVELLTRRRARERLFDAASGRVAGTAVAVAPSIADADPDTWGLLPEHQAGARAAMLMAGPPAAPRST